MTINEAKGLNEIVAQFTNNRVTSTVSSNGDTNAWVAIWLDGRLVTTVTSLQQFKDLVSLGWFLNVDQNDDYKATPSQIEDEIDNQVNLNRVGK